jgi:regulator of protease activity HflC (stomatin/prohibitin superfamily)
VKIDVHPMLLYRIVDPVRAAYETFDLTHAIEKLVQTTLRSIIGQWGGGGGRGWPDPPD